MKSEELEKEILKIKERNQRVESDKTWETSWTRRIFIGISAYIIIAIFLVIIEADKPLISAIIPALAYIVSTLSLDSLRTWWLKRQKK